MPQVGTDTCGNPAAGKWFITPVNIGHEITFFKLGDSDRGNCDLSARPLRPVPNTCANDASSVELMLLTVGGAYGWP